MTSAMSTDEIDELARRAKDGDRLALETLLGAIRPRALNVCRGVLPHLPDAEDACQDTLIKISQKMDAWNGTSHFTSWAHVVALNSARSAYRRMRRQAAAADPHSPGPLERPDPHAARPAGRDGGPRAVPPEARRATAAA
jgi:RNA polymerase sigma-70 factor (ECF subfamily)